MINQFLLHKVSRVRSLKAHFYFITNVPNCFNKIQKVLKVKSLKILANHHRIIIIKILIKEIKMI